MKAPAFSFGTINRAGETRMREAEDRAEAAVADLSKCVDMFTRYGVTLAVLFGSNAARRPRADSDIDLLVFGPEERLFFRLKAELEERLRRDVDLHTGSERAAFVQRALRTGIKVYESK